MVWCFNCWANVSHSVFFCSILHWGVSQVVHSWYVICWQLEEWNFLFDGVPSPCPENSPSTVSVNLGHVLGQSQKKLMYVKVRFLWESAILNLELDLSRWSLIIITVYKEMLKICITLDFGKTSLSKRVSHNVFNYFQKKYHNQKYQKSYVICSFFSTFLQFLIN